MGTRMFWRAGIPSVSSYYGRMSISRRGTDFDRDVPAYTLAEAARYLRLPVATLRSWALGTAIPDRARPCRFSASDPARLPEAALALVFQLDRGARTALAADRAWCARKGAAPRPCVCREVARRRRLLLRPELRTDAGKMFLERYGELIGLTASGQLAMRRLFDEHLKRVEWTRRDFRSGSTRSCRLRLER